MVSYLFSAEGGSKFLPPQAGASSTFLVEPGGSNISTRLAIVLVVIGVLLMATPRLYVSMSKTEYRGDCARRAGFYWNTKTHSNPDAIACMETWEKIR